MADEQLELEDDYDPLPLPKAATTYPEIPHRQILKEFFDDNGKSGEIRLELGSDGVWLQFDCDCKDALPYCQAQCCALVGTAVLQQELEKFDYPVDYNPGSDLPFTMQRGADGFCNCLDRKSRTCTIYGNHPQTCKAFHCTRGADVRGFKLPNHVLRQAT
ncbi:MAG TPA: YkgJ family cysteine cluster protein [Kamptonema sp.]|nr:YkgJ family cysteine cluster protein [Kamptonema sp.]